MTQRSSLARRFRASLGLFVCLVFLAGSPQEIQRRMQEATDAMDSARTLLSRGDQKASQRRLDEAEAIYRDILRMNPESRDAAVGLSAVLFLERRYEEGVALMRPFHDRSPDDLDVTHQLGIHLYRSGEQGPAVPLLETVAKDERRFDASWLLLQHYYRQANWQAGIAHAERYLKARPDDTEALALIGTYFLKAEQYDRAIATLDRYLAAVPDNVSARINRANALFRSGQVDKAGAEYERLLADQPDKSRFLYNLASVRIKQDRCTEALTLLDRFLVNEPKNGPALYFRADCLLRLERYEDARLAFERAGVDGQSNNPWVWYGLSRVALRKGELNQATEHASQAVALAPTEAELANWLGSVHRKAKRPADALTWHDKAIKQAGDVAAYHLERGHDLWALVRYADSLAAFEKARTLEPELGGVNAGIAANRAALGAEAWKVGDMELAETHLAEAVAALSSMHTARANLAVVLVARGKLAEASRLLAEAPKGNEHPELQAALSLVRLQEGALDEAGRLAKAARDGQTSLVVVTAQVQGQLAARRGDWEEAVRAFEEAQTTVSSPNVELARALSQLELGLERLGRGDAGGARDMFTRAQRFSVRFDAEDRQTLEFAQTVLAVLGAENAEAAAKTLAGQLQGQRFAGAQWARVRDIGQGYVAYGWLRANNAVEARKALEKVRDRAALGVAYESILSAADDVEARRAFQANDFATAERLWAAMVMRNPQADPALKNNLGAARFMAGKTNEAEAIWRPLADAGTPVEALYNLGNALARKGEHRASWDLLQRYGQSGGPQADRARERAETKARLFGFGGVQ